MEYYQKLREIRKKKNKSQEQIARILDISQQSYNRYEHGKPELPIKHLITLCQYYRISADQILGTEQNININKKGDEDMDTKDTLEKFYEEIESIVEFGKDQRWLKGDTDSLLMNINNAKNKLLNETE